MLVAIIGLGLIGGSFAKAYAQAGHTVLAVEKDRSILQFAMVDGCVSKTLTDEALPECDLVLICTYPGDAIRFMTEKGPLFGKKPIVIDCCGTKRVLAEEGQQLARGFGFTYVGGHPMAGAQYSGFKYAKKTMFQGASMVIVPPHDADAALLNQIKKLLSPAGFSHITVTTAEKHDEIIAFTSQLAHLVSNAYVKSPTARKLKGLVGGSYKDMTRVAWLNPEMWAELFLANSDNLVKETDTLIKNLQLYRNALVERDYAALVRLLKEGKTAKEEIDS